MSETSTTASFQPGPYAVPSVTLPVFQRFQLERWAAQAYPLVACGLLYGHFEGDSVSVVQTRLAAEAATGECRDVLDPSDHRAGEQEARELGLEIVGTWRSRPNEAAVPTPDDRAHAWAGWSHVLVAIDLHAEREVRSWRFDGGRFVEEEVAS
ncbi:MAG: Mov34/MPN/PAD-1 family protein [Planctomycetota bacterium]|nr:Mov34/MPN/PAD-1 family protein [Planctomycetota bacterium]